MTDTPLLDSTNAPPMHQVVTAKEARNFLSAMGVRKPHLIAREVIAAEPGLTLLAVGHRLKFGPHANAVTRTEKVIGRLLRTGLVAMASMAEGGGLTATPLSPKILAAIRARARTWTTETV